MIQIYNRDFDVLAEEHLKRILATFPNIVVDLSSKIPEKTLGLKSVYKFLFKNINQIIIGNPTYINDTVIPYIDSKIGIDFFVEKDPTDGRTKKNKKESDEMKKIFNYDSFRIYDKETYNAYDLAHKLNINVCPYCNRQYSNTLKPNSSMGGTRPTLDHFYIKSKYPYLALSFWNLVPSCYSCNSQLRTNKDIGIHPYIKGFEGILHFQTEITDLCEFIDNRNQNFDIKLKQNKKHSPSTIDIENANKNKDVFRLEDLYNQCHKDYVKEIIQKAIIYSPKYSENLYQNWEDVFNNKNEAKRLMLGNYTNIEDLENRPLAKLTKDIAEELNLI
ncbi:MAG: hypothetical protein WCP69_13105 [Bacteroidota bacterium]